MFKNRDYLDFDKFYLDEPVYSSGYQSDSTEEEDSHNPFSRSLFRTNSTSRKYTDTLYIQVLEKMAKKREDHNILNGIVDRYSKIHLFEPKNRLILKNKKNIINNKESEKQTEKENKNTESEKQTEKENKNTESEKQTEKENKNKEADTGLKICPEPNISLNITVTELSSEKISTQAPLNEKHTKIEYTREINKPWKDDKKILHRLCLYTNKCRKSWCPYAHSFSELKIPECRFGKNCRWVDFICNKKYTNKPKCRPCNFIHPRETTKDYLERVRC